MSVNVYGVLVDVVGSRVSGIDGVSSPSKRKVVDQRSRFLPDVLVAVLAAGDLDRCVGGAGRMAT